MNEIGKNSFEKSMERLNWLKSNSHSFIGYILYYFHNDSRWNEKSFNEWKFERMRTLKL